MSSNNLPGIPNLANMRQAFNHTLERVLHEPGIDTHASPSPAPTEPTEGVDHLHPSLVTAEIQLALAPHSKADTEMTALGTIIERVARDVSRIYQSPIFEPAVISNTNHPYRVEERHRNHGAVFVASAQTINVLMPGVGAGIAINLALGWTQIDYPPGTEITGSTATAFNALFQYSMDRVANA